MRTVKIPAGIDAQVIADYYRAEVPVEDAEELTRIMAEKCAERERGEKGDKGERPERSEESKKGGRTGEARRARRVGGLGKRGGREGRDDSGK
jgi:hypothetical protein